ncbi:hypothetical protein PUN28_004937 [Cardiocondyla obscurior]|uniref:Uncharacterized protein n=1 Tax=Cardiocondyla obscurior TaxID=286306 RepID=A0AAW2GJ52_9HYME
MTTNICGILLLTFALSLVKADERERWNTPPELTPESVKMLNNKEPQTRFFPFIPVTTTVGLNAGNNNAYSVSIGASLDGISLSESSNYNHPTKYGIDGSSVSKSSAVSAGLSGISSASAEAYSHGNRVKAESHSVSFGQATAASFGTIENGQAITGVASSAGTSLSSASDGNHKQLSQASAVNTRYPDWSTWSNIGPSNKPNDQRFNQPTLTISKPHVETRPVLELDVSDRREEKPTIHIYKWRPNHKTSRPSISIESNLDDTRNGRTNGWMFEVKRKDSKQKYTDSDFISDIAQTVGELFDII